MGISDILSKLFRKKRQAEALQIDSSASSDLTALQKRSEALEKPKAETGYLATQELPKTTPAIEVQKDSLQLGVAAGYAGRSLKGIESSLNRIETQMPTKEWFISQFEDKTPELVDIFKKHEENEQKRFKAIQNILNSLRKTAEKVPEPVKTELVRRIKTIEDQLPLTPKMNKLLEVVKEAGEISYNQLHLRLNVSISALRGLLANMVKRTKQIERFKKDGKGWVRYKE